MEKLVGWPDSKFAELMGIPGLYQLIPGVVRSEFDIQVVRPVLRKRAIPHIDLKVVLIGPFRDSVDKLNLVAVDLATHREGRLVRSPERLDGIVDGEVGAIHEEPARHVAVQLDARKQVSGVRGDADVSGQYLRSVGQARNF